MLGRVTHRTTHGNELLIHHSSALFNKRPQLRCDWPPPHSSCGLLLNNALEWCISNSFPWVVRCVTRPSIPVSRSIAVFLPACPAQILRQGCLALARCRHDDRSQRKTSLASD